MSNRILDALDREIAQIEAIMNKLEQGCDAWREIDAHRRGVLVAKTIVSLEFDKWFNRKLSWLDTEDIRQRVADGETQATLAKEYQVSPSLVSRIVNRTRR
jgi:alpha-L-arabinofuranosidase